MGFSLNDAEDDVPVVALTDGKERLVEEDLSDEQKRLDGIKAKVREQFDAAKRQRDQHEEYRIAAELRAQEDRKQMQRIIDICRNHDENTKALRGLNEAEAKKFLDVMAEMKKFDAFYVATN